MAVPTTALPLPAAALQAGSLFAIQSAALKPNLVTVDPLSGAQSTVADLSTLTNAPAVEPLAASSQSSLLYAVATYCSPGWCPNPRGGGSGVPTSEIVTINPQTAAVQVSPVLAAPLFGGIAIDPATQTLWALTPPAPGYPGSNPSIAILRVDPTTGAETTVATHTGEVDTAASWVVLDPASHVLYVATVNDLTGAGQLLTLDTSTGSLSAGLNLATPVSGLVYDTSSATLFGVTTGTPEQLAKIDPATGTETAVATFAADMKVVGIAIDSASHTIFGVQYNSNTGVGDEIVTVNDQTGATFVGAMTPPPLGSLAFAPVIVPGSVYTAMTPTRLLDTRYGGRLGAGGHTDLPVGGTHGVPSNATAVILNVTAVGESTAGFFTVYPTGGSLPIASNLNWVAGETVPNLVSVGLGTLGYVTIYNGLGSADAVVDLQGYFAASGGGTAGQFVPVVPARITDTRTGSGQPNAGMTLGPGTTLNVQMTSAGPIPAAGEVSAVVLNVTATDTTSAGFFTVFPTRAVLPVASNLNWTAGVTVPNRVIVPIGTAGQVSFYNGLGSADVVIDVNGYFTTTALAGAAFTPLIPARILDTRYASPLAAGLGNRLLLPVGGNGGVPSNATAVILNVTVARPTTASDLVIWPDSAGMPVASDLNFVGGQTVPNLVVVKLSAGGKIDIFNAFGTTDVIVDVVGWYG
jgi:hypothetical protein